MRLTMQELGHRSGIARRRRKYGNIPTVVDGHRFDSKLEARRYQELKLMLLAGQIQNLEVHCKFPLEVSGKRIGHYEADFAYLENGKLGLEDCKGVLTPLYRWKRAHVLAQYGIEIREIRAKSGRSATISRKTEETA